jgi:hypothetical protein
MTAFVPDAPAEAVPQLPPPAPDAPTQPIALVTAPRPIGPWTQEFRVLRALRSRHVTTEAKRRDWAAVGVAVAASLVSIAACTYFYLTHRLLGYQDSYSHLEISRRILMGRTTGIAQLGAIWLPVPHLCQALFAWNRALYVTGLAGAVVSMAAFVACATLIYRIVRVFSPRRALPAIAAAAAFMTDANMLYQQTTAMDELPFFAFALAAIDGLVRWVDTGRANYLLRASLATMLAMLCRYEGWFLAGMLAVAVPIMARRTGHSWRDTRGLTVMFGVFGVLTASGGWLFYNWAIAGSPTNFLYGPNSSADQMAKRSGDVEIGSWPKSLHAYGAALVADHGLVFLGIAALGLVAFLVFERFSARALPILALSAIVPFYVATIENGQEPIEIPPVNPFLLNLRFGLVAALPAAVFVGYLFARLPRRLAVAGSALAIIVFAAISANAFRQHSIVTAREAADDAAAQSVQAEVGEFLELHTAGPIMVNMVGNERVAFQVLDRVIYEGTKSGRTNIWRQALDDPRSVGAQLVLMRSSGEHGSDEVYSKLHDAPAMSAYHVIFSNDEYTVYQLGD